MKIVNPDPTPGVLELMGDVASVKRIAAPRLKEPRPPAILLANLTAQCFGYRCLPLSFPFAEQSYPSKAIDSLSIRQPNMGHFTHPTACFVEKQELCKWQKMRTKPEGDGILIG